MFIRLFAILFGTLICALATAQSLDDRVRELERRPEQLEKGIGKPSTASTTSGTAGRLDGWKQVEHWRSLRRGMTEADVRSFLGEPERVGSFSAFTVCNYPGGRVNFDGRNQQVDGWTAPLR